MTERPTIADVAKAAGVHPGTASRALNPALIGRVSKSTTLKVERAAQKLGYVPNNAAKNLRTRTSDIVGVLMPDLGNPVFPPIVRGIEDTLRAAGYIPVVSNTDNDPTREAGFVATLRARQCAGFIIASATRADDVVDSLTTASVPAVLVNRQPDASSLPFVTSDDEHGVDLAVSHLADLGHTRIGHVTGPKNLSSTAVRQSAFAASARRHGIRKPPVVYCSTFTADAGGEGVKQLLKAHPDVTAVFCGNDMVALGAYAALADLGLSCPDELSVVGYNDMPLVEWLSPALTTVAIPQYDIGAEAAKMLLRILDGETGPLRQILLQTELKVRGSTAPPRRHI